MDTGDMILKEETEKELSGNGRLLIRESGTEPVIRIMVESGSQKVCENYTARVEELINSLGLSRKES